jgi:two-component system chemotaxis response regulator CheB
MTEFPVVAIGASAGGLDPVRRITEALPRSCGAAVVLVMHVGAHPSHLPDILNWHGKLPAMFAEDGRSSSRVVSSWRRPTITCCFGRRASSV